MEINFEGVKKLIKFCGKKSDRNIVDKISVDRKVEASSLEAQGHYGRAIINMSFKGSNFSSYLDDDFDVSSYGGYTPCIRKFGDEMDDRVLKIREFLYGNYQDLGDKYIETLLSNLDYDTIDIAEILCFDEEADFPKELINDVLRGIASHDSNIILDEDGIKELCTDKQYAFARKDIAKAILNTQASCMLPIKRLFNDRESLGFSNDDVCKILNSLNGSNVDFIQKLCGYGFSADEICKTLSNCHDYGNALKVLDSYSSGDIPKNMLAPLIGQQITIEAYKELEQLMGKEELSETELIDVLSTNEYRFLYGAQSIDELSLSERRFLMQKILDNDYDCYVTNKFRNAHMPLVPRDVDEENKFLSEITRSLSIKTKPLGESENKAFNQMMTNLSSVLKGLSDDEFNRLEIKQDYSNTDFINDVLSVTKDMSKEEKQKLYNYFGFELYANGEASCGFSILGYPANPDGDERFAGIKNPKTKEAAKKLKSFIVQYSENNSIRSNNKEIETYLNKIVELFPELRLQIGKIQHSEHSFNAIKHSLKVMQKTVQNPKFESLSDSDKKVMLFASLMHDIAKKEGKPDNQHASESAFDVFYISNKLSLNRNEQTKLYGLVKNHEWLKYLSDAEGSNRLSPYAEIGEYIVKEKQSVAFDMRYDNLFDLAQIFTEADLKAVKDNDSYFDRHKKMMDAYSRDIKQYIFELKSTQSLLPVTKIPKASTINKAITKVNPDYSTNIKGIYKDENGLIIIKFNEVEDWEKIGFPKGSVSKGIKAKGAEGSECRFQTFDVNTGNIKFFIHALTLPEQLVRFDAFSLPDSDTLLSVTYAERPESKYKFYKTQGVLLNTDTINILGGSRTDSGSRLKKDIDDFKEDYMFGGSRESERYYIPNMIKDALGLNDEEYAEFVNKNVNKDMTEIEPPEAREKLIKTFAGINSEIREGGRQYNEMFMSNPEVMCVFAYSADDNVGNIKEFMQNTNHSDNFNTNSQGGNAFLREYALKNDMPFIIFGD